MRKLLLNLHLYAAFIAGAFIAILGLTGSVMAFEPEIDHLRHWKLAYVTPQPRALSLAEISAAISRRFQASALWIMVIVDQYSGKVLYAEGSRTAPGGRRIEIADRAFHTGDIFGMPTQIVMSLASLMAPVQLVTGIMMWWRRRKC